MKSIPYGTIPKVLLIGNGINRSFEGASWDAIINECEAVKSGRISLEAIKNMSMPLKIVAASEDHVDMRMQQLAKMYQEQLITQEHKELVWELLNSSADAILTTNYNFEIEKTVLEDFSAYRVRQMEKCMQEENKLQKQFRMFRCYELPLEKETSLWHIHGNAFYKHSVIMGHYYYGKLLAEIEKYIPVLQARYRGCNQYRKDYQPHSWVDYFLIGDVHIVGMGMDLSEMDLWWLACCKKRNFPDRRTIFYNPDSIAEEKTILMNCYGIEEVKDIPWNGNYVEYYKTVFQMLQKNRVNEV